MSKCFLLWFLMATFTMLGTMETIQWKEGTGQKSGPSSHHLPLKPPKPLKAEASVNPQTVVLLALHIPRRANLPHRLKFYLQLSSPSKHKMPYAHPIFLTKSKTQICGFKLSVVCHVCLLQLQMSPSRVWSSSIWIFSNGPGPYIFIRWNQTNS